MSNTNVSFSEEKERANTFGMESGCDSAGGGPSRDEVRGPIGLCQFLYDIIILRVINSGMLRSPTTTT